MKNWRILIPLVGLLLSSLACGFSTAPTTTPVPTITRNFTPTYTITVTRTRSITPLIPVSGGQTFPQVTVSQLTNCRSGPGTTYTLILPFLPGQTARVLGKYRPSNYWIINTPAGGVCWLWGQYAKVTGDVDSLAIYAAPPLPTTTSTPTHTSRPTIQPTDTNIPTLTNTLIPTNPPILTPVVFPPLAPTNFTQNRVCTSSNRFFRNLWIEDITINWQDNSSDETGFRIFNNGSPVSDLPAGSTEFQTTLRYNQNSNGPSSDTFGVVAFNDAGESSMASIDIPRCP
jgi:hypothetical protein